MKSSLVFFIVVLSVIVVLNEACSGQSTVRTTPTTRPATSSTTSQLKSRPQKIHSHRIFSFSLVTTKPKVKPVCTKPNLCLPSCGTNRYIVGRYNCTGQSWCCKLY